MGPSQLNYKELPNFNAIGAACAKVFEVVSLLRLTEHQMQTMWEDTVRSKLLPGTGGTFAQLEAFAMGCLQGQVQVIQRELCDFVYRVAECKGALGIDEVRYFGLRPHIEGLVHFSSMTDAMRLRATCGFAWRGSAGEMPFSHFGPDEALRRYL